MQYKALFVAPNRVQLGLVAAKEAQSREAKIKRLTRKQKLELINKNKNEPK